MRGGSGPSRPSRCNPQSNMAKPASVSTAPTSSRPRTLVAIPLVTPNAPTVSGCVAALTCRSRPPLFSLTLKKETVAKSPGFR